MAWDDVDFAEERSLIRVGTEHEYLYAVQYVGSIQRVVCAAVTQTSNSLFYTYIGLHSHIVALFPLASILRKCSTIHFPPAYPPPFF